MSGLLTPDASKHEMDKRLGPCSFPYFFDTDHALVLRPMNASVLSPMPSSPPSVRWSPIPVWHGSPGAPGFPGAIAGGGPSGPPEGLR